MKHTIQPPRFNDTLRGLLCPLLLVAGTASAGETTPPRYSHDFSDDIRLELTGYDRIRITHRSEMLLSEIPAGVRAGEQIVSEAQTYSEHRLRLEPSAYFFDQASVHMQLDLFSGMVTGDTSGRDYMYFAQPPQRWNDRDAGDFDNFVPDNLRRLWGRWASPVGEIRVGRMGSDWGLGLVANSGDGFTNDFGDAYYGDIVDRVAFATKPISIIQTLLTGETPVDDPLILAVGYDWNVVRDSLVKREEDKRDLVRASTEESTIELQDRPENDETQQFVAALRLETEPFEGGFYAARKELVHQDVLVPAASRPDEEFLDVWALDLFGRLTLQPAFLGDGEFFAEAELAYVTGETNLSVSRIDQSPDDPFPESDVEQFGLLARAGIQTPRYDVILEGGYASGDADPFDDEVRNFRFHPDLNVGMILFEDLLAETSAASARNATLVFNEGGPVRTLGADLLPTNGGVTNAIFVHPKVRVRPWEHFEGILGVLWARTDTDFVDPTLDFIQGGGFGVFNPFGAPASNRELGWEVDVALRYTIEQSWSDIELGLQYGHLFPGDVFENREGKRMADVDKVQGRVTFFF